MLNNQPSKEFNITVSVVLYKTNLEEVQTVIDTMASVPLKYRLYLIDNSPFPDIEKSLILTKNVVYIHTGKNLGFGSGHNVAINIVQKISEFHLVLNADVIFKPESLEVLYNFMVKNPDVGLVAPKIFNLDNSIQYSVKLLPTPINLIVRRFLPIKVIQDKLDRRYELKFFNFDRIIEVPYVMGCFMFINTDVFEKVGGFDERFFMYPEDIDLTRRIHEVAKTLYYPEVSIYHKHGKGSYKSFKLLYYHVTSMIKYFNKWGWFYDKSRNRINKKVLSQFNL